MFAGGEVHINGIKLFATVGTYGHGNGKVLSIAAGTTFECAFGQIRGMTSNNFQYGDFKITTGKPHSFDGEVTGKLDSGFVV